MKKLYPFLFFLFCLGASAQTGNYIPFPDSSAGWNQKFNGANPPCYWYGYSTYYIKGDTLINSVNYKKIYEDRYSNGSPCNPIYTSFEYYSGALRNDIGGKRVLFVEPDSITERLVYDFSVAIGDTISTDTLWPDPNVPGIKIVIDSIDSVLVNGNYHRRFNYTNSSGNASPGLDYYIEGIGSGYGLFPMYFVFEGATWLLCFTQNGQSHVFDSEGCVAITAVPEETISPQASYYFSDGLLHLNFQDQTIRQIRIYDVSGREVYSGNANAGGLDLTNLKSGLYFFQAENFFGKFLAQ
jgi:hypothetical protein